nr:MAG: capsid protein [Cressdnaviricota sp.]
MVMKRRRPSRKRRTVKRKRSFRKRKERISTLVMRKPGDYMPERFMCKLRYYDSFASLQNSSNPEYASYTYKMNSVYDPDPAFASGAVPGFIELAAFYNAYRVVGFGYKITFNNASQQQAWPYLPYTVYCGPYNIYNSSSSSPPSAITANSSSLYTFINSVNVKKKMLGVQYSGKDTQTISGFVSLKRQLGLKQYDYDPNFAAPTNGEPTNRMWFFLGAYYNGEATPLALNTLLINLDLTFTYYVEFFQRKTLTV